MVILSNSDAQRRISIQPRHRAFYPALILLLGTWATFSALSPGFFSAENLTNLLIQTVPTALAALAITLLLIVGKVDLSVAAIGGFSATIFAIMMLETAVPEWLCWLLALGVGAAVGAAYGLIAGRLPVPSFVLTLAGLLILTGVQLWVLSPQGSLNLPYTATSVTIVQQGFIPPMWTWIITMLLIAGYGVSSWFHIIRRRRSLLDYETPSSWALRWIILFITAVSMILYLQTARGVSAVVMGLVLIVILVDIALRHTPWGYGLYTMGHDPRAARLAGLRVARITTSVWIIAGSLAALSGLIATTRLAAVHHSTGATDVALTAFAAALIGGASTRGGRGSAWSAVVGALVIQSLINGLTSLTMPLSARMIVVGVVLAAAVFADAVLRGRHSSPHLIN